MTSDRERNNLDRLMRRTAGLCRAAAEASAATSRAERMCLIADLDAALRALKSAHDGIKGKLLRTQHNRVAITAYGRAQKLRPGRL